ncbi:AraC family transcriptional regulator [Chryseolinea sp. H1M3-3]|uniref:helix-turn-helix domain-containing protein n=1 Tax=Chryseolinea sp. H1M3-3 TaxID=3034144 RepID=UPI0023EC1996|nr:AraC family transcriptional regulator [Chryseolinea sp. H1M3-3]
MSQLFQIFINGGIVLGVFVILLLNNKGVRKSRANTFLSVLLGALTFSTFHLRYAGDVIHHFSFKAYSLGDPTFLLIPPLLWFYITELTGGRVRLSPGSVAHFLPFLVMIFCSISFGSFLSRNSLVNIFDEHPRLPYTLFWVFVVVQFSCYQYLIHRKWRDYQHVIKQEVSNTENVSISWVQFFMGVFLVINIFFLFGLFAVIHFDIMNVVWKSVGVLLSLSIFALGYKGILQREIFYTDLTPPEPRIFQQLPKPEKPSQDLVDKLIQFMEDKKPYLDAELSLSSLSKQIGLNRNQLSQLINEGVGENFYDFINKYRVEEVKRLMADPQKQHYNLLGMALEAGFKSKSTFNLIFKRFTGLTPTEYKKNSM